LKGKWWKGFLFFIWKIMISITLLFIKNTHRSLSSCIFYQYYDI
jgi:hypothetical protein